MSPKNKMYVRDRRYGSSSRRPSGLRNLLLVLTAILLVATFIVAAIKYLPLWPPEQPGNTTVVTGAPLLSSTRAPEETAEPTQPSIPASINPQLLPLSEIRAQTPGLPAAGSSPSERNLSATVFDNKGNVVPSFSRSEPFSLVNPAYYNQIPGVLTFRGNNFRNAPAFGLVQQDVSGLEQIWTNPVGSLPSSSWTFSWTGTGWTGQPLLVQWEEDIRRLMNIREEKKAKTDLVEVIYATMDGQIYFYDLDDGQPTRPPIKIGAPIKGTPSLDPRGYPILYVGQGDKNPNVEGIGFRVFNLIDQSLLLYKRTEAQYAYRPTWNACDSSPIFDAKTDSLVYPNENGLIYTAKMNTVFDRESGEISIAPEFFTYRYKMSGLDNHGVESSMAVYDGYGYFSDNSGFINCIDLNSLQPVWSRNLGDDSDVTPVLALEDDRVVLYIATEVDWQKEIVGNYQGSAFVYKFDALTGAVLWESFYDCWTKNAANYGDDVNGGAMGTPVVGKQNLTGKVIFSFCMTKGPYSGNSVVAYNTRDGSVDWEYTMPAYSWSSPIDVYDENGNGYIIIPDSGGNLHLIDGRTGTALDVILLTKADGSTPAGNVESSGAVFGNTLVVGTRGNVIVGIKIK